MPRDLPGLYWDDDKKRYFPISSRPAGTAPQKPAPPNPSGSAAHSGQQEHDPRRRGSDRRRGSRTDTQDSPSPKRHRAGNSEVKPSKTWNSLNSLSESTLGLQRRRCMHQMQMQHLSTHVLDKATIPIQLDGHVMALCAKGDGDKKKMLVGDSTGWLYSVETNEPTIGIREFGLRTQVTSISRSGPICMVTSLGSPARLLLVREDFSSVWLLRELPPSVCSDVWCGQVRGHRATVGGRKAVVSFTDLERDEYVRIHRSSDVLALCQQDENITYLGMRNGIIDRWDSRQPGGKTDTLINMSEKAAAQSGSNWGVATAAIDHVRVVHGHALLVRTMRGDLETHDLRFLRGNDPLLQFRGHAPNFESKQGVAVDPGEDFLFSGGRDPLLRIWSLRTGEALPPREIHRWCLGPQEIPPIRAMEVVEEEDGVYLWVGRENWVGRIELGPRGVFRL